MWDNIPSTLHPLVLTVLGFDLWVQGKQKMNFCMVLLTQQRCAFWYVISTGILVVQLKKEEISMNIFYMKTWLFFIFVFTHEKNMSLM